MNMTKRTNCAMRLFTREDQAAAGVEETIPKDMAALTLDNNGWVGTNNGYPGGQPALYNKELAEEIKDAWWYTHLMGEGARKSYDKKKRVRATLG